MEVINYQELKREAYLMAIEQLEAEYSNNEEALKRLEKAKEKYLKMNAVWI